MSYEEPTNPATNPLPAATRAGANQWEATKEKAAEAMKSGERYVRENPGTSTLSVLGIGFGLGLLVGWGLAHESHDDHATQVRKLVKRLRRELNLD